MEWWDGISGVNQVFFVGAAFFSVFFLWQLVAALIGLGGDDAGDGADGGHADGHVDVDSADGGDGADAHDGFDGHDAHGEFDQDAVSDAHETVSAFKLFSVRSIVSFFTLFCWAGALYLQGGVELTWALLYALLWGLAAMIAISWVFSFLVRFTETGNLRISTAVGTMGTVYLDIPQGGTGEARVAVSGVVQVLKARGVRGTAIKSGTPVAVTRTLGPNTIEVKAAEAAETDKEGA